MKKEDIIESGMIEDYVLGLLSEEDRGKMEGYLQKYPAIANLVDDMELSLEKIAKENRISPPPDLKQKIIDRPAATIAKTQIPYRYLGAAFLLGCLLAGTLLGLKLYKNNAETQKINQAYAVLQEECEKRSQEYAANEDLLYFLSHEATVPVQLRYSETDLIMYHNPVAQQAKIQVRELPEISAQETFQMWADVDGKMISMGIFSTAEDFQDLQYIAQPESFNVTIEPSGGSNHPTVSRLVVSASI